MASKKAKEYAKRKGLGEHLAYLEKTSPWRGFWMQFIEIIIFILNASGAALVGMGTAFIPFVAMTVAGASIFRSFLEFSNLTKHTSTKVRIST